jgi:RNA polymerase sigma factor FliA
MNTEMLREQEQVLWDNWFQAETKIEWRQKLILFYQDWLGKIAGSFYRKYYLPEYELQDFIHWSTLGLIESIDRYQVKGQLHFKSYAYPRLKGSVLNHLKLTTEKQAAYHGQQAYVEFDRIDSILECTNESDGFEALVNLTTSIFMGNLLEEELVYDDPDTMFSQLYRGQSNNKVSELITSLPQSQQIIMHFHYYNHLSFVEIAQVLDISKGRVSQLHNEALNHLKFRFLDHSIEESF